MSRFLFLVGLAVVGTRSVAVFPSVRASSNTTGSVHIMDELPKFPSAPNTIMTCMWWWDNDASISCKNMPAEWGISMANFLAWNPSITPNCGNYVTGLSYCVEAPAPALTTTTTTTSTGFVTRTSAATTNSGNNGITTPTPIQPNMVENCDAFHLVRTDENCDNIANQYGITRAQFVVYNPSVGDTCTGMWANVYVCVSIIGSEPSRTTSTPVSTTTSNGIATPSPTQPGMITDCNKFYFVKSGDTCVSVALGNNLSQTQFLNYNPSVGTTCNGLWLNAYVCVGRIDVTPSTTIRPTTTTKPTSTKVGNGVTTPTPIQDGMVSNCNKFHFVSTTTTCQSVLDTYKITLAQFTRWNPSAGSGCNNLWGKTYACVGVIS
ncbi:hypothetical protein CC86DRAFT_286527 [Ophiobolus disseminans]|uniref:LysM domain-containing protein n=1 Tax=Ophiobolus disseminans TaxID=1469910 RepID=A0A6A7A869_9PLEO|nr:hypothetical protein CC86DRAFT_286527 [Ophiobolus disseminans]